MSVEEPENISMFFMFSMFSMLPMFSKLTPCSPIRDGRIQRFLQPWPGVGVSFCCFSVRKSEFRFSNWLIHCWLTFNLRSWPLAMFAVELCCWTTRHCLLSKVHWSQFKPNVCVQFATKHDHVQAWTKKWVKTVQKVLYASVSITITGCQCCKSFYDLEVVSYFFE